MYFNISFNKSEDVKHSNTKTAKRSAMVNKEAHLKWMAALSNLDVKSMGYQQDCLINAKGR